MTITADTFRRSGAAGKAAAGLARCGVIPVESADTTSAIYTKPIIRIFSSAMVWLHETDLYTAFTPKLEFYDVHTFELTINPGVIDHTLFLPKGFLSYQTPAMPNPYLFIIDSKKIVVSSDGAGSDEMMITGRGVKCCLDFRRHMEEFNTGTGYDIQTGVAYETAMRHWITQEIISPTDTARRLTGVTFAGMDEMRGGTVDDIQKRTESPLDTVIAQSKVSALGFDFVWSGSGLNFTIPFYEGTNRYTVGDADCVTLSAKLHNIKGYEYLIDYTPEKNVVYVGGTGDGAARALQEVYTGTEPTGWDRRETFLDGSDCTTADQMIEKGLALLVDSSETTSLDFEYDPSSQSFIFGKDFTLGDIVNVVFSIKINGVYVDVITSVTRIISVAWTYDENGVSISMTAGKRKPDWIGFVKMGLDQALTGGKH